VSEMPLTRPRPPPSRLSLSVATVLPSTIAYPPSATRLPAPPLRKVLSLSHAAKVPARLAERARSLHSLSAPAIPMLPVTVVDVTNAVYESETLHSESGPAWVSPGQQMLKEQLPRPLLHAEPSGAYASAGHCAVAPLQNSATSHVVGFAGRHSTSVLCSS